MRYLERTDIKNITNNYDYVIGWGTGPIFRMNYQPYYYPLDLLIDGAGNNIGDTCKGLRVESPEILNGLNGRKLIIIFAIYEKEIREQIERYSNMDPEIDTVIYALLDITLPNSSRIPEINGKCCEDLLLVSVIRQLGIDRLSFLEIGVCHPVMRNNTYMLYENYSYREDSYKGVLVEANPLCWPLIEEYRPKDTLIKKGVVPYKTNRGGDNLSFYMFPHLLGHSTFLKDTADKIRINEECIEVTIPVTTIDQIIKDYFGGVAPDILAIDAEGLDYEILKNWNEEKKSFKIIVSEVDIDEDNKNKILMEKKGYKLYARTLENSIWIRSDIRVFL